MEKKTGHNAAESSLSPRLPGEAVRKLAEALLLVDSAAADLKAFMDEADSINCPRIANIAEDGNTALLPISNELSIKVEYLTVAFSSLSSYKFTV